MDRSKKALSSRLTPAEEAELKKNPSPGDDTDTTTENLKDTGQSFTSTPPPSAPPLPLPPPPPPSSSILPISTPVISVPIILPPLTVPVITPQYQLPKKSSKKASAKRTPSQILSPPSRDPPTSSGPRRDSRTHAQQSVIIDRITRSEEDDDDNGNEADDDDDDDSDETQQIQASALLVDEIVSEVVSAHTRASVLAAAKLLASSPVIPIEARTGMTPREQQMQQQLQQQQQQFHQQSLFQSPIHPIPSREGLSGTPSFASTTPTIIPAASQQQHLRRPSTATSRHSLATTVITGATPPASVYHRSASSVDLQIGAPTVTLEAARPPPPPPITSPPPPPQPAPWLDPEHFRLVFRQLAIYTEQLEGLSDQILEAMTLYRPPPPRPVRTSFLPNLRGQRRKSSGKLDEVKTSGDDGDTRDTDEYYDEKAGDDDQDRIERGEKSPSPTPEEKRRMKGKEKAPINLEEERLLVAQAFTDLTMECWPRIYKIPSEPRTEQATKDRIKIATELKDAIVAFWSVQSHFQECAQLVLDIYQDPSELQRGNKIRILKSRHLNNLLSRDPMQPFEVQQALDQYHIHNEKLVLLSEQLQNIWLGILMLLGDPDQTRSATTKLGRGRRLDLGGCMIGMALIINTRT
ncbi:hypothetical protein BGZ83_002089 [Gryganskiella cystojenkinii]|nr:hypothetical protein BGZ83_002089 [Gryganskiella cystojenkinii]